MKTIRSALLRCHARYLCWRMARLTKRIARSTHASTRAILDSMQHACRQMDEQAGK